jgi:surfeit locus 1 family protein
MRFRPLLWPTLIAIPAFCVLIVLGMWQMERREWKLGLIATMRERLAAPEVPAPTLERQTADFGYRPTWAEGRFDHTKTLYWITPGPHGEPAFHILTPLMRENGPPVIIDRGFVPTQLKDQVTQPEGPQTVHGIARESQGAGAFTPADDPEHRLVFVRDVSHMAALMGLGPVAPFFIEAVRAPGPVVYPLGGQTQLQLRNEHLQYAITWFGLAGALLMVYLLYHRSRGRLG